MIDIMIVKRRVEGTVAPFVDFLRQQVKRKKAIGKETLDFPVAIPLAAGLTAVERNGMAARPFNIMSIMRGREAVPWDGAADRGTRESCTGTWRIIADIMFTRRA